MAAGLDAEQKRKHWEKMEEEEEKIGNCLGKITEICPGKIEEEKAEMLYQTARLFELEEILSNLFYQKIMEK